MFTFKFLIVALLFSLSSLFAEVVPTDSLCFSIDADFISAANGQTVDQWNDLSSNGFHISQGDSGLQPVYIANGINGHATVRFDGSELLIRNNVAGSDIVSSNQATVFVVQKQDGADDKSSTIAWGRHLSNSDDQRLLFHQLIIILLLFSMEIQTLFLQMEKPLV